MRKLLNLCWNSTGAEAKAQECSLFARRPFSDVLAPLKVLHQLHTHPAAGGGRGRPRTPPGAAFSNSRVNRKMKNFLWLLLLLLLLLLSLFECYPYCIHIVYSFCTAPPEAPPRQDTLIHTHTHTRASFRRRALHFDAALVEIAL